MLWQDKWVIFALMKKWHLKAIVQKTISYLPYSSKVNFLFQKYVTKGVYLTDDYFYDRLEHASNHIKGYADLSDNKKLNTTLELGTGWYPVVPICMYLCGAEKIYTVDLTLLTNKAQILTTIEKFIECEDQKKIEQYIPFLSERFQSLESILKNKEVITLNQILEKLHLNYLVQDARKLSLQNGSIDLITSNNTFEHVYPFILKDILKEFKRIARAGGLMSHFIDMSDHFAHFDKSITIYNYLQFSEKQWQLIDNTVQPQNRLRITDYKKIYADLVILITREEYREGNLKELNSIKLNESFLKIPNTEIAKSHCHFYSKM